MDEDKNEEWVLLFYENVQGIELFWAFFPESILNFYTQKKFKFFIFSLTLNYILELKENRNVTSNFSSYHFRTYFGHQFWKTWSLCFHRRKLCVHIIVLDIDLGNNIVRGYELTGYDERIKLV